MSGIRVSPSPWARPSSSRSSTSTAPQPAESGTRDSQGLSGSRPKVSPYAPWTPVRLLAITPSVTVARMGNTRTDLQEPTPEPADYEPPAVKVLGTLEELTRGHGGRGPDDFGPLS